MNELFNYSQLIKKEAEELLLDNSTLETLNNFGEVKFTGSYELDLMYKKDIDISLVNDNLSVSDFTQLGKELIDKLNTPTVYFRNTRITPVARRPENALYWGIKTGEWFLDIWAMNRDVYSRAEKYIEEVKSKLTTQNKIIILQLKADLLKTKTYGNRFSSRELYDGVLNHGVKNVNQLNEYLIKQSSTNEYR